MPLLNRIFNELILLTVESVQIAYSGTISTILKLRFQKFKMIFVHKSLFYRQIEIHLSRLSPSLLAQTSKSIEEGLKNLVNNAASLGNLGVSSSNNFTNGLGSNQVASVIEEGSSDDDFVISAASPDRSYNDNPLIIQE